MSELGAVLKSARPRVVAALRRVCGDLAHAEDACQDAIEAALRHWPEEGLPDNPTGWLVVAGKRRLIDRARKHGREEALPEIELGDDDPEPTAFDDDLLRLIFTCCHPAIAEQDQVALTLKVIIGLSNEDVARAFLVPVRTMEQRLARARKKIRDKGIPYAIPDESLLPERLDAVLATVYLIFNQGYSARRDALIDVRTCEAAIWLAALLMRLFPGNAELMGLSALMRLHHARHRSRSDADGGLIPLPKQNRSVWDVGEIEAASALLKVALGRNQPGPYQTQAAIAAVHCEASEASETDWPQIAALYAVLEQQLENPVISVNRAVALGETGDTTGGLEVLDALQDHPGMSEYTPYLVARARLAELAGDLTASIQWLKHAVASSPNDSEQQYLSSVIEAQSNAG